MKKTMIALAIAVAGSSTMALAAPKDNTWYLGGKVGWSSYHDTGFYNDAGYRGLSNYIVSNDDADKDQLGGGLYLGYQANPYIGFELGYDWLGRLKYNSVNNGTTSEANLKVHGIQLTTKLSYPITDTLDIYTRLGGMVWRADVKVNSIANNGDVAKEFDTGVSPLAALGFEYAFNKNIAGRLDYQWVSNIGDGETVGTRPDNGMLSLGLAYRFGQSSIPVPAVVAPVLQTRTFDLKSDVLFNFGKNTLKPEGRAAIDLLFNDLRNVQPTGGHVTVVGFTDHIGSETANLALSQRRAQVVADYLVSKGIPSSVVSARGAGESSPVTGNSCDGVAPRNALIQCLAPDRRVAIEVTGTSEALSQ